MKNGSIEFAAERLGSADLAHPKIFTPAAIFYRDMEELDSGGSAPCRWGLRAVEADDAKSVQVKSCCPDHTFSLTNRANVPTISRLRCHGGRAWDRAAIQCVRNGALQIIPRNCPGPDTSGPSPRSTVAAILCRTLAQLWPTDALRVVIRSNEGQPLLSSQGTAR